VRHGPATGSSGLIHQVRGFVDEQEALAHARATIRDAEILARGWAEARVPEPAE
jgi:hypothetical protein